MSFFSFSITAIFILAVLHMFFTPQFYELSKRYAFKKRKGQKKWKLYHFLSELFYMLSELEVVFGLWLIPLFFVFMFTYGWQAFVTYLNSIEYSHALFMTVLIVVIGSRPIMTFAETILEKVAKIGKDSPASWWWTIMIMGPLLSIVIKEPGAMTVSSILLVKKFMSYPASRAFKYASMGLLFGNIAVGAMLTPYSSRAFFLVAEKRGWDLHYVMTHFGWKSLIAIFLATIWTYFLFRRQFSDYFPKTLPPVKKEKDTRPTPIWVTCFHLLFLTLIILTERFPPLFVGIFILFLGFWRATKFYQIELHLKEAVLAGFFLGSLLIHGELQGWWILPLIQHLNHLGALLTGYLLSIFVDNAAVSYFTVEAGSFDSVKYNLIVSGAMSAGGLTVLANAPNVIGYGIMKKVFDEKLSFVSLFLAVLIPSVIFLSVFWFLR